jgi:hypothetical protein
MKDVFVIPQKSSNALRLTADRIRSESKENFFMPGIEFVDVKLCK